MMSELNFIDYINDSVRLLIILEAANRLKPTIRITESRIRLFDYYLKFPRTMFGDAFTQENVKMNFDEYYAFFHWKPNIAKYRNSLNYLIAKGLIDKRLEGSDLFFIVKQQGREALLKMKSGYKKRLSAIADKAIPMISTLTDKKIEEEIARKNNTLLRRTGGYINED
jgi:hypothetical protein